ncbi:MAG: hypothetical protein KIS77_05105 [Saprospiraceae bacterium]|nr:hypothetical protein [Saprospiraceae bacterium]
MEAPSQGEHSKYKKNNNCSEFKEYIDSVALKTERQNPAWDEFSLEKVFEFVGEKPKNATICIITSETSGEVYSNETIVFWLKHNRYIGAFWVKGDLRPFEKSKHDYTKLKRMSTLCNKGYTSFGEIIFTEINGENMWVKAVLFPTIEQENSIYSFMSSGD